MAIATAPQTQSKASAPPQIVKAAVIACFDPRIQAIVDEYRRGYDLNGGKSTPHHPPGASLYIEEELPRLDLAVQIGATEIHILEHRGPRCYGYQKHYGADYDPLLHRENLLAARKILASRYPRVIVFTAIIDGKEIIPIS